MPPAAATCRVHAPAASTTFAPRRDAQARAIRAAHVLNFAHLSVWPWLQFLPMGSGLILRSRRRRNFARGIALPMFPGNDY